MPKNVVINPFFDWGNDRPPHIPYHETVIYEAHVRGLTLRHPEVPRQQRGTYAGLAHPAVIAHLQRLGVTAVELMPVHQFVPEHSLVARGLTNYWGYNTIGFLAPHNAYSSAGQRGEQVGEFKSMVKALHEAGIEVILDVVYNHTAEGDHRGPTLSFRGIDNAAYYRLGGLRAVALPGLHRLREQPQRPAPARAAAGHGLTAVLGPGDARRRVPLRPGLGAGQGTARRGPAVRLLRPGPAGPGGIPGQADRRAVGRRRGRLPGRQLPAAVERVERQVPGHRPGLLARPPVDAARVRLPADRVKRPVRDERAPPRRLDQLRHLPRRLHPDRPGLLQPQAQRGQRRGQPGRHRRQPVVELRGRGPDRRPGRQRAAGPAAAQLPGHLVPVPGRADAAGRRRDGPHPARQQQRLLPGQRDVLGGLEPGRRRAGPAGVHRGAGRPAPRPPGVPPAPVLPRPEGAGRARRATSPG